MPAAVLKSRPPGMPGPWPLVSTVALGTRRHSVTRARLHTRSALRAWELPHLADDAELIISELVTNALQASWALGMALPVLMRLRANGRTLVAEVWDAAPAPPAPRPHTIDAQGGRGLEIVSLLSEAWGYYPEYGGKVVWALLHGEIADHYRERPICPGRQFVSRPL